MAAGVCERSANTQVHKVKQAGNTATIKMCVVLDVRADDDAHDGIMHQRVRTSSHKTHLLSTASSVQFHAKLVLVIV
jgi:hypothetical protein